MRFFKPQRAGDTGVRGLGLRPSFTTLLPLLFFVAKTTPPLLLYSPVLCGSTFLLRYWHRIEYALCDIFGRDAIQRGAIVENEAVV